MLLGRIFFLFLFVHVVNLQVQINLYLTDWVSENNDFQHDCLHVPAAHTEQISDPRHIISYCMSEWPSKFNITENNFDQKLTFFQLSEQHITSGQLYLWSAPIDLIEQYQMYLDQLPHLDETLATQIFYNCTLPYFGSKCQYILDINNTNHSSINEIIHDYYRDNLYEPTLFTCYLHLECNRGPSPLCLDWTEICDGNVDCLGDGSDEEHCWQLAIHQCNEDEFQCSNGQCIPRTLLHDDSIIPDCLDQSDNTSDEIRHFYNHPLSIREPTFIYEDTSCAKTNHMPILTPDTLTSSCIQGREHLLSEAIFLIKPNSINDECWKASKCIIRMPISSRKNCSLFCDYGICDEIIKKECPNIIFIPAYPIPHGHVYFAYNKSKMKPGFFQPPGPTYVCYDKQLLSIPDDGKKILAIDNKTCRLYADSNTGEKYLFLETEWLRLYVNPLKRWLHKITTLIYNNSTFCDKSIMYQCMNSSKCISKARLFDDVKDCYYEDDENPLILNNTDLIKQYQNYFRCKTDGEYIPFIVVNDGMCDCIMPGDSYCADEDSDESYFKKTISFQTICDKFLHLASEFTEGRNETDETNCDQWPLIHIYNRCDGFWHFLNGSDEVNCDSSLSLLNCTENNHVCVSSKTNELMCLPIEKANDGIIDCIGAADEATVCHRDIPGHPSYPDIFYCKNPDSSPCIIGNYLCDGKVHCSDKEDERACKSKDLIKPTVNRGICMENYELDGSDVAKALCRLFVNSGERLKIYFTLDQSENSMGQYSDPRVTDFYLDDVPSPTKVKSYQPRCHRGLPLQILLHKQKNLTRNVCLCPPSYYGDICQYQNQRISLTLQFRVTYYSAQIPFIIIISLIDNSDERIIHSYEQFTYLVMKHCQKKFNFYLLYSTRPKNSMKNYSIHIDFYEKLTLSYRGSIIKALDYWFLPVHRLAYQLDIPHNRDNILSCSNKQCINGKCMKYFDDPNNKTFCQCNNGWSGQHCTLKYTCVCSSESVCIGKLANNRSLCVCPLNKMGPRCLIDNQICQMNQNQTCRNDGQCILIDEYEIPKNKFICICSKGFSGDRCEIARTKFIVSFDKNLDLSSSIFFHFIEVKINSFPIRTTTLKQIRIGQNSVIIYWSLPFHIVFIELSNKTYYLITMQKTYKQSTIIEKSLNSSHLCLHINELFNETILNYSFLRRIKYYHLPCQTNLLLLCFYDEQQFCLCQQLDQHRVANCLDFNHNSTENCVGQNDCENGGQCFQENSKCPKYFLCRCPVCYYGSKCESNTNGFSLSLDAILVYHIHWNIKILKQPRVILISLILSTIIIVGGTINSTLSLITFKTKQTRELGCGIYFLCTSILTLLLMIIFTLKFWILILSQIGTIQNRLFLNIQCHSIDFLIRFCLTMDQWLTACVSIERAYIIIKGVNFNKKKTRSTAKWTIFGLVIITILTHIHDPIYRRLFNEDDDEENRLSCIVKYPSGIRIIDSVMSIFHFVVPFIINLISAIIIITRNARQRVNVQTQQKYKTILTEQIEQHKHLLIGPCVLIILGISRLIISFTSGCMKSGSNSWLFLLGYFISLIPPILTFILFVLPSTLYRQAFGNAINRYKNMIKITRYS